MGDDYWRDRDLWRAQDAEYDREVAFRDRIEADERGCRALSWGNTAEALRSVMGPDAALYYHNAMSDVDDDEWPPHHYPLDAESLAENVNELPYEAEPKVRIDEDDVRIVAVNRYNSEVIGSCSTQRETVVDYLVRANEFARTDHARSIVLTLREALGWTTG